jgi:hypothetical protein
MSEITWHLQARPRLELKTRPMLCPRQLSFDKVHGNNSRFNLRRLKLLGLRLRRRCLDRRPPVQYRRDGFVQTLHLVAILYNYFAAGC